MKGKTLSRSSWAAVSFLVISMLFLPTASQAQQAEPTTTTYSGQATVVQATILGLDPVILSDTGPLPPTGGAQEASLLDAEVPGLLTAEVLHASTIGQGNRSRSEASVANLNLTVAGNTIAANFLMSRASAECARRGATVNGSSEIVALDVNGQRIVVTGEPNQTIALPGGGSLVINEQTRSGRGSYGAITVNALHIIVPGVADVIIASAHADINCPGNCEGSDFITGGGWIVTPSGARGTFGVTGGIRNNAFWGHLTYIDHGANIRVRGTGVTAYTITGPTSRRIEGTAEINGVAGTYQVDVSDKGEPGRRDTFRITLSTGYTAGGSLPGGNIQLHKPCR